MTGDPKSNERKMQEREDQMLSRLIECLDTPDADAAIGAIAEDPLGREYLELLGLMPYSLDSAAPAAQTRQAILTRLTAAAPPQRDILDRTLIGGPGGSPGAPSAGAIDMTLVHTPVPGTLTAALPHPASSTAPLNRPEPAAKAAPAAPNVVSFPDSTAKLKPWLYSMAAMLGLCLLGLSFMAGRLSELTQATAELNGVVGQVRQTDVPYEELLRIRDRFDMITNVAQTAYPMRSEENASATGTIFVCGAHQQWYLHLKGLEPPPPKMHYSLWFLTQEGTVHGGSLNVAEDSSAELEAPNMPEGTRGFGVTLEEDGTLTEEPQGPFVMLSKNSVSL